MQTIAESLDRAKYLIGIVIGLITYLLQYFGLEGLTRLPADETGLVKVLLLGVVVVFTLIIILLSKYVEKANKLLTAVIVGTAAILSVGLSLGYKTNQDRLVSTIQCADKPEEYVVRPQKPSPQLQRLIAPHVDLETAWCDSSEPSRLRRLAQSEDSRESNRLIISLILAQSCMILGIMLLLWKINLSFDIGTPPRAKANEEPSPAPAEGS